MPISTSAGLFDAHYYATGCGRPYRRDDEWLRFFGAIADRIVADIAPHTVLDAGCAMGFLVEALRQRGVEAFGMDVSEYAIGQVHPSVRSFCWVGSIAEPLPQRYDLIVCIEVLEHMPPAEAQRAIAVLCAHTDDILFSSTPFDYREATHFNVQPPEAWAEQFARHGFVRDVDYDASFITPWAVRYRRRTDPSHRWVRDYERRYWVLAKENQDLRALALDLRNETAGLQARLVQQDATVQDLSARLAGLEARWAALQGSMGWALLSGLQRLRARLAPPLSSRDRILEALWQGVRAHNGRALGTAMSQIGYELSQQARAAWRQGRQRVAGSIPRKDRPRTPEVPIRPPLAPHTAPVDIVICVHDALEDVRRCLESVIEHTSAPYTLVLVDDGSEAATRNYLAAFAGAHNAVLLRNETASGYTRAANAGLRQATAEYVVLLNSDTIVTPGWLDRLVACADSHPTIGLVGPLSNAATWQSIPEVQSDGDWATNALPEGLSPAGMAALVARDSARAYPTMPFLNGFCLLIKRSVLREVGYFDEDRFGAGYGEENDYALRARRAGWQLALADDAYVYHAGSRSYAPDQRRQLIQRSDEALVRKHGARAVHEGSEFCRRDRVLEGIRAHSRLLVERQGWVEAGRKHFAGRRVLFLLPISVAGGGGNIVLLKARLMREMGVEVAVFNRAEFRESFERAYGGLDIPALFGKPADLPGLLAGYDAVVATVNTSVPWLVPTVERLPGLVRGYFIQDFEPYFYPPGSEAFEAAWASYAAIPDMVRFATSRWIQQQVIERAGVGCRRVGPCFDVDLFRPRPRLEPARPALRIAAMIRPETPYRSPRLTAEVLRAVARRYGRRVEITLFGAAREDPGLRALPLDFPHRLVGQLNPRQMAYLFNQADIFADFSVYQALGIAAQEAMACGAAVIVPQRGGTDEFARHEENCLVVDTSSRDACEQALCRLVEDGALRERLQGNALRDVCAFYPERPAYNILAELFGPREA